MQAQPTPPPTDERRSSRHTPGPWAYLPLAPGRVDPPHKTVIAIVKGQGPGHGGLVVAGADIFSSDVAANGRLLAAATEMLAALKTVRDGMVGANGRLAGQPSTWGDLQVVAAAINKAEG